MESDDGKSIQPIGSAEQINNSETEQQKREFWDDLLGLMEDGYVVPVIGAELFAIPIGDETIPLYRMVAEKLLEGYDLTAVGRKAANNQDSVILRPGAELSDAVWAISKRRGKRLQDLYRPVHDVLKFVVDEFRDNLLAPLQQFASIPVLKLFISTSCDNLLASAINLARHEGRAETLEIQFAPNLPGDKRHDLPAHLSHDQTAVFYLFGRAAASPIYAIHEEDMLEFMYKLQQGLGCCPTHLLGEVRTKNLLFIGCPLTDWLGRFLVRTSNEKRLLENRDTREFMVVNPTSTNQDLTTFLESYSHETRIYFSEARTFVDELTQRWLERHPPTVAGKDMLKEMSKVLKGSIFISYASQDYEMAHQLYEELKDLAGVEDIAFFDKGGGLEWGDEWEPAIMQAIKSCRLFLPLISKNTQKRFDDRPVFLREWCTAEKEDEIVLRGKFVLPLIIDEETALRPVAELMVPFRFREKHFGKAIGGHLSNEMRKILVNEIRNIRRTST